MVPYAKFDGVADTHLWTVPAAGGAATQITTGAVTDRQAVVSPDGTRIAWQRGANALWVADIDGSGAADISPGGGTPAWPQWHPTLMRLVFTRGNDVCRIEDDGTGFTVIAAGGAGNQKAKPQYNRDGTLIAYLDQTGASTYSLHTMQADGTGDAAIGSVIVRVAGTDFNWLHGSDVIVYGYVGGAARNYFKINADGTGNTQLDTPALTGKSVILNPGVVSDDSFCVFSRFNGSTGWDFYKLPLSGSGQTISSPVKRSNGANGDGPLVYFDRIYAVKVVAGVETFISLASDWSDERTEDTPGVDIRLRFT